MKFTNAHFKPAVVEQPPAPVQQQPQQQQSLISNIPAPTEYTPTSNFAATIDALNSKINWATNELRHSHIVKYNIELCEMIKAASDAIVSLKKA